MCDRNDHDFRGIDDVDNVVLERPQPSFTYCRRERLSRQRAFGDECGCGLQVSQEAIAQAFALLVEILDSLVNLSLSRS